MKVKTKNGKINTLVDVWLESDSRQQLKHESFKFNKSNLLNSEHLLHDKSVFRKPI